MRDKFKKEQKINAAKEEIMLVLAKHLGEKNPDFLFEEAVASVLTEFNHKKDGILESNFVGWMLSDYVARSVGPHVQRMVRLAEFLEEKKATAEKPYNFGYGDRYAAVLNTQPKQKLVALQTQSMTYLLKLELEKRFVGDVIEPAWSISIRYCTRSSNSQDYSRPDFKDLQPKVLEGYFRYGDGRDRGYMLTADVDNFGPGWEAKHADWISIKMLQGILYDLHCHASQLPTTELESPAQPDEAKTRAPKP